MADPDKVRKLLEEAGRVRRELGAPVVPSVLPEPGAIPTAQTIPASSPLLRLESPFAPTTPPPQAPFGPQLGPISSLDPFAFDAKSRPGTTPPVMGDPVTGEGPSIGEIFPFQVVKGVGQGFNRYWQRMSPFISSEERRDRERRLSLTGESLLPQAPGTFGENLGRMVATLLGSEGFGGSPYTTGVEAATAPFAFLGAGSELLLGKQVGRGLSKAAKTFTSGTLPSTIPVAAVPKVTPAQALTIGRKYGPEVVTPVREAEVPFSTGLTLPRVVRNLHQDFMDGTLRRLDDTEQSTLGKFLNEQGVSPLQEPSIGLMETGPLGNYQILGAYDAPLTRERIFITFDVDTARYGAQVGRGEPVSPTARLTIGQIEEWERAWNKVWGDVSLGPKRTSGPTAIEALVENTPATPPRPPRPPSNVPVDMPAATPPSGRPRTLADMNNEARAMRALTPEQRAGISDVLRPIDEGDLIYQVRPFNEHAQNLLQADSNISKALRAIPGVKQTVGIWTPAQMGRTNPLLMLGVRKAIFLEIEKARARWSVIGWRNDADRFLRFRQKGSLVARIAGRGADQPWVATRVQAAEGVSTGRRGFGTIDDILENPQDYILTTEQQTVIRQGQDMTTQLLRDAQRAGVDVVEMSEAYWHRIVIRGPNEKSSGSFIRGRVSGRKGHTMQRAFQEIDVGKEKGFVYETNPATRLAARLEAGIETIANANVRKQIAQLPEAVRPLERLEQRFPATIEGLKEARVVRDRAKAVVLKKGGDTVENFATLREAEAGYVTAARDLFDAKRIVSEPSYTELRLPNGRIAPAELVAEVEKYISLPELTRGKGSGIIETTEAITKAIRTNLTTADLAAGYIQGQVLFLRNNVAWWKAQFHSLIALVDDPMAYVSKNFDVIDEGTRMGAISSPTELLYARTGLASVPQKIPLIGPALKSFNRAFEWFILVGQTELYKAARSGILEDAGGRAAKAGITTEAQGIEDLVSVGTAIRKQMGTESTAILGIGATQGTIEALLLFAPRFFRANTGLLVQSFTRGPGGAEARKAIGSLIAGGTGILVGVHYLRTGKMPNVDDPFAPDWMQTPLGNSYVNPFGPFYSLFRALAQSGVHTANGEPSKAAKVWSNFMRSKQSVAVRILDVGGNLIFRGEAQTFEGERIDWSPSGLARAVQEFTVPISPGDIIQGLQEGRPEEALGVIGLTVRGTAFSQMDIEFQRASDINPEGKSYRYATPNQRREMRRLFPDIAQKLIDRGRGKFGQARREWDQSDKDAFGMEEGLAEQLLGGIISIKDFRDRYSGIQRDKAIEKATTNKRLDLFQEEQDLPDDPDDRALAQYYRVFGEARTVSGLLDFDIVDEILSELREEWTPEQEEYVDLNTGLTEHPALIQQFLEDRETIRDYLFATRDAARLYGMDKLYREWRVSQDQTAFLEMPLNFKLNLPFRRAERDKTEMRLNDPVIERILYKWGYINKPINSQVAAEVDNLKRQQGGSVTNRLAIDDLVQQPVEAGAR